MIGAWWLIPVVLLVAAGLFFLLLWSCRYRRAMARPGLSKPSESATPPSITISSVPENSGTITGTAHGGPEASRVAIFVRSSGGRWRRPGSGSPFAAILPATNVWSRIFTPQSGEYAALLVHPSYRAPFSMKRLPAVKDKVLAVTRVTHDEIPRNWQLMQSRQQRLFFLPEVPPRPRLDENVQFTVYRPRAVSPGKWYSMLAFAHLSERPIGADPAAPDPVQEVRMQAHQILGEQLGAFQELTQDSTQPIPRLGEITFVPQVAGIEFNPRRRSFQWSEPVHREEFRLRALEEMLGRAVFGRMSVFLGSILIAEVALSIRVGGGEPSPSPEARFASSSAPLYRKIFASYSHKDVAVVEEFERHARAVGDEYLRDLIHLRTGEVWDERLRQMIEGADVFQLFWSWNSIESRFVEQEWRHALSLDRPRFIRPVFWEEPLPAIPERKLPPDQLLRFHFQRVYPVAPGPQPDYFSVSNGERTVLVSPGGLRRAEAGEESAAGERGTQMSIKEHLGELRRLLLPVPVWWLLCALVAAALAGGGWFHRLLAVPVYALPLVYPLLCFQVWRFARPGMWRKETGPVLMVMGSAPLIIAGLAWIVSYIDRPWIHFLGAGLETGYHLSVAKAIVVSLAFCLSISAGVAVKQWMLSEIQPALWWCAAGILFTAAPAVLSGVILCLLLAITAAAAIAGLILPQNAQ